MEPMILARTERRNSVSEDGVTWWSEYRLIHDERKDRYEVQIRYLSDVGGVVYARIAGKTDYALDPCETWEYWTHGETPEMAVDDVLGDSRFFAAESLSELHRECVERLTKLREKNAKKQAVDDAQAELESAEQDFADWKDRENKRFTIMHGDKTEDLRKLLAKKMLARLEPTKQRYLARIQEAKENLEKLQKNSWQRYIPTL